jgi:hypothetical protein
MRLDRVEPEALARFSELIDDERTSESKIHRFMENNTEFIPTFVHYLHHGIWANSILSKYPIGPLVCDFVFLTKHTQLQRVVFIELKLPSKRLFAKGQNFETASNHLHTALDQIRGWKAHLDSTPYVLNELNRLWGVVTRTVDVKFTLVMGRNHEIEAHPKRKKYLSDLDDEGIRVITYDTILNYLQNNIDTLEKKCILSPHLEGLKIKVLDGVPHDLLTSVGPDYLRIDAKHRELFERAGFDMVDWHRQDSHSRRPLRARSLILPEELRLAEALRESRQGQIMGQAEVGHRAINSD